MPRISQVLGSRLKVWLSLREQTNLTSLHAVYWPGFKLLKTECLGLKESLAVAAAVHRKLSCLQSRCGRLGIWQRDEELAAQHGCCCIM